MKAKHFIYLILFGFVIRISFNLLEPYLLLEKRLNAITLGLISGIISLLIAFATLALIIKIYRLKIE